jgi:hypothetical protein
LLSEADFSEITQSRHFKKAAKVLPEPVGEHMSTFLPDAISGHPRLCGSLGEPMLSRNQSLINGLNPDMHSFSEAVFLPISTPCK